MIDESLVCLDDRDPVELALSVSPPTYFPSSLTFLLSLSFLLLLEKNDLPPEDCLDAADMIRGERFDHHLCHVWVFLDAPGLERIVIEFIGVSELDTSHYTYSEDLSRCSSSSESVCMKMPVSINLFTVCDAARTSVNSPLAMLTIR